MQRNILLEAAARALATQSGASVVQATAAINSWLRQNTRGERTEASDISRLNDLITNKNNTQATTLSELSENAKNYTNESDHTPLFHDTPNRSSNNKKPTETNDNTPPTTNQNNSANNNTQNPTEPSENIGDDTAAVEDPSTSSANNSVGDSTGQAKTRSFPSNYFDESYRSPLENKAAFEKLLEEGYTIQQILALHAFLPLRPELTQLTRTAFDTPDQAAATAYDLVYRANENFSSLTITDALEFGALIVRNENDGKFYVTMPNLGLPRSVDPGTLPQSNELVAYIHTHPFASADGAQIGFSLADVIVALQKDSDAYVLMNGSMVRLSLEGSRWEKLTQAEKDRALNLLAFNAKNIKGKYPSFANSASTDAQKILSELGLTLTHFDRFESMRAPDTNQNFDVKHGLIASQALQRVFEVLPLTSFGRIVIAPLPTTVPLNGDINNTTTPTKNSDVAHESNSTSTLQSDGELVQSEVYGTQTVTLDVSGADVRNNAIDVSSKYASLADARLDLAKESQNTYFYYKGPIELGGKEVEAIISGGSVWHDFYKQTWQNPPEPVAVKVSNYVLQNSLVSEVDTVVVLGGAAGYNVAMFADNLNAEVISIDSDPASRYFVPKAIEKRAKEKGKDANELSNRVTTVTSSFENADLPNGIDVVWSSSLSFISHEDAANVVHKTTEAMSPNGTFGITIFGPDHHLRDTAGITTYSEADVRALLENEGLEIVSIERERTTTTFTSGQTGTLDQFHVIARKRTAGDNSTNDKTLSSNVEAMGSDNLSPSRTDWKSKLNDPSHLEFDSNGSVAIDQTDLTVEAQSAQSRFDRRHKGYSMTEAVNDYVLAGSFEAFVETWKQKTNSAALTVFDLADMISVICNLKKPASLHDLMHMVGYYGISEVQENAGDPVASGSRRENTLIANLSEKYFDPDTAPEEREQLLVNLWRELLNPTQNLFMQTDRTRVRGRLQRTIENWAEELSVIPIEERPAYVVALLWQTMKSAGFLAHFDTAELAQLKSELTAAFEAYSTPIEISTDAYGLVSVKLGEQRTRALERFSDSLEKQLFTQSEGLPVDMASIVALQLLLANASVRENYIGINFGTPADPYQEVHSFARNNPGITKIDMSELLELKRELETAKKALQ
ncbi:MAG: DUF4329 domain-containing protein [Casimicrobium sp.]